MLVTSLLIATSLLCTSTDKLLHSPCGIECGFALEEKSVFNPADEVLIRLARIFPMDFVMLGCLVLYIFSASLFGVVQLGIRVFCFGVYNLRKFKSMPQALLVMCLVMCHILLVLCTTLLTIAPNYTTFGSQQLTREDGTTTQWCSLGAKSAQSTANGISSSGLQSSSSCHISVIAMFFSRISVAMPFFSVSFFFANWAFLLVFVVVFAHCIFFQEAERIRRAA